MGIENEAISDFICKRCRRVFESLDGYCPKCDPLKQEDPADPADSASDDRTANNAVRHQYRVLTDAEKQDMLELKDLGAAFLAKCEGLEGDSVALQQAKINARQAVMWAVNHVTE